MSTKTSVSLWTVAMHTILVVATGGFWLIPLVIWYLVNNKK